MYVFFRVLILHHLVWFGKWEPQQELKGGKRERVQVIILLQLPEVFAWAGCFPLSKLVIPSGVAFHKTLFFWVW